MSTHTNDEAPGGKFRNEKGWWLDEKNS